MNSPLIERHIRPRVVEALGDTRVVVVIGARQAGKSTLVEQIAAHEHPARLVTFDDQATRQAALEDPTGFVAGLEIPAVIDEVQRAPDALLAIKQRVDRDRRPGQFLLTGSANVLTAPRIADALTGRAEYYRLWPFTQGELRGAQESIVESLFAGRFPQVAGAPIGRRPYAPLLAKGGYPEAQARVGHRRVRFFAGYIDTIMQRDLRTIARVHEQANVRRLLDAVGSVSSSLLNFQQLGRSLGIPANTLRSHVGLLETLFLIRRIPAWHSNLLRRVIKSPKIYVADCGLLAYLIGASEERVASDGQIAGMLFETFVSMELLRQTEWHEEPVTLYHYRDKQKREVDLIVERRDGAIVGVEIKAAASVSAHDFRGLRHVRDACGDRFKCGVVIYTGGATVPFGDRLAALPLPALWT